MSSGARRSRPSGSGAAFRNPETLAAWVRTGRLQIAPVAWKNGSSAESSRRMMARPSGCSDAGGLAAGDHRTSSRSRAPHDLRAACRPAISSGERPVPFEAIGFREDDVERHRRGPEIAQAGDELSDDVPAPGPLADGRQAAIVDVHDDDAAVGRPGRRGAQRPCRRRRIPSFSGTQAGRARAAPRRAWAPARTAPRDGRARRSSDRDFDPAIARFVGIVGGLDEERGFAVRGHFNRRRIETRHRRGAREPWSRASCPARGCSGASRSCRCGR